MLGTPFVNAPRHVRSFTSDTSVFGEAQSSKSMDEFFEAPQLPPRSAELLRKWVLFHLLF